MWLTWKWNIWDFKCIYVIISCARLQSKPFTFHSLAHTRPFAHERGDFFFFALRRCDSVMHDIIQWISVLLHFIWVIIRHYVITSTRILFTSLPHYFAIKLRQENTHKLTPTIYGQKNFLRLPFVCLIHCCHSANLCLYCTGHAASQVRNSLGFGVRGNCSFSFPNIRVMRLAWASKAPFEFRDEAFDTFASNTKLEATVILKLYAWFA